MTPIIPSSHRKKDLELSPREQRFILQLKDAFRRTRYPGDDHIIDPRYQWEWSDLMPRWKGRRWSKVPLSVIVNDRTDLPFFTVEGFVYYLPAWLLAATRYPIEVDTLIDSLEVRLSPPNEVVEAEHFTSSTDRFTAIADRLTLPPKKVIFEYLLIHAEIQEEVDAKTLLPVKSTSVVGKKIWSEKSSRKRFLRYWFPAEGDPPESYLRRAIRFWTRQIEEQTHPQTKNPSTQK